MFKKSAPKIKLKAKPKAKKPNLNVLSFTKFQDEAKAAALTMFVEKVVPNSGYIILIGDGFVFPVNLTRLEAVGVLTTAAAIYTGNNFDGDGGDNSA